MMCAGQAHHGLKPFFSKFLFLTREDEGEEVEKEGRANWFLKVLNPTTGYPCAIQSQPQLPICTKWEHWQPCS